MSDDLIQRLDGAANVLRARFGEVAPRVALVAGSGLSGFGASLLDRVAVPYTEIPGFPRPTAQGHAGELVLGRAPDAPKAPPLWVLNGRKHLYEGASTDEAVFAVRALVRAGTRIVILTNAAGSIQPGIAPGEFMLIADHINLQFRNPLLGPNADALGTRFPDMSAAWDPALRGLARRAAVAASVALREGVYIALSGPTYETRAEVQMMRAWGDAVGMSTVPENLAVIHAGARCLGISVITNSHVHQANAAASHEEVLEMGRRMSEQFSRLIGAIVREIETEQERAAS